MNFTRTKFKALDLTVVLILLLIGITFSTSLWRKVYLMALAPPVLSSQDWEDISSLQLSSYNLSLPENPDISGNEVKGDRYWVRLSVGDGGLYRSSSGATIIQEISWYADQQNASLAWKSREKRTSLYLETYLRSHGDLENYLDVDLPENIHIISSFKCLQTDGEYLTCVFWGETSHWFTQLLFKSSNENTLSQQQMTQLIEKAVVILLKGPEHAP